MAKTFVPNPNLERDLAKDPQVSEALLAGAHVAAERARALAPRLTGKLADSIRVVIGTDESGEQVARVIADDFKAHWVEFGTVNAPAHPYLRPAAQATFREFHPEHRAVERSG